MDETNKELIESRKEFNQKYDDFDEVQILKEILYAQTLQVDKLERLRANSSKLVWWLVAIPIISFVLFVILGGFGQFFT
ncbi:MAG: hypothetical protein KDB74_05050 [Flavobacteriales bacterium]|nr:hypothetical protein [Flavobacteriales bacterium]